MALSGCWRSAGVHGDAETDTETDTNTDTGTGTEPTCPVHVDGALSDYSGHDGSTWALVLETVQEGINAAAAADGPCSVWVAAGEYAPTEDVSGDSSPDDRRTMTILLKAGVALYGGFAGDETALAERDIDVHETILSGGLEEIDGDSDTAYHVVTGADSALIDGFTIAHGNANGPCPDCFGGGMYNVGSSPTVTNCTFSGNLTGSSGGGGGMYNDSSSPDVANCIFKKNTASPGFFHGGDGGGMYNVDSSPTVTNCTFSDNKAHYGGGMYNVGSSPVVTNCIFWGDTAQSGSEIDGAATVTYSDVLGGYAGTGNIDGNPLFVDPEEHDLRLREGSPCIDAGTADALLADVFDLDGDGDTAEPLPWDADGNSRLAGADVDMGAYEYQP